MIKQSIARILSVELDRKDFLKALGIGVVAATGVTAAVNSVVKQTTSSTPQKKVAFGYGESVYGGHATNR
ncbi:MAG: hypothetical protein WAQ27_04525 [Candidatus Microsaccharimonas sp.]